MSILTSAIYDRLSGDETLTGLLAIYKGLPAIFTTDPAPGDTGLPFIVTAGEVTQVPSDTKTTRGRELTRDVRCYANADGSAVVIETIAERVYALLHRYKMPINDYQCIISNCGGPIVADEKDFYGRIISLSLVAQEE